MESHPVAPEAPSEDRSPWLGLPGRVLVAWVMAGGVIAGGFIPGTASVLQRTSASVGLGAVALLFGLGAAAGLAHGGLLGYIGRKAQQRRGDAIRSLVLGAVVAVPCAAIAFLVATWISMSGMALSLDELNVQVGSAVGWAAGIALCAWAALDGWRAFRGAYERWNESATGTILLSVIFALLAYAFTRTNPEIWGTNVRVVGVGAVLLAFGATIWIALPVVAVALHLLRRWRGPLPGDSTA